MVSRRFDRTKQKTNHARALRREATPWERKLWAYLQSAQVEGVSFRRQHPLGPYVLDFYAPSVALAIEVDGGQRGNDIGVSTDRRREEWLRNRGITVLRFWNSDIVENIEGVVEAIRLVVLEHRKSGASAPRVSSP